MDLFPNIFATLKAASYFSSTLSGFTDSENRFKVFEEGMAPSSVDTPYITVEIVEGPKAQATNWEVVDVMLHFWGTDKEIGTLVTMRQNTETIFTATRCFSDGTEYRIMGDIRYDKGENPVLEQVTRSLGLSFGIEH
ncbi:hypothetical protein Pan258_01820 [Symmachiella dynata]|uniref:hypothetical protein n=1 Tax=Symmachiella dynata TaxID=2527995 RepID=UPI001188BA4C|nr:hypothetical protein [Symmachiella dynata]QDT46165.1 hypothetical protein Pan258_01820 [Symmachiella dynata]